VAGLLVVAAGPTASAATATLVVEPFTASSPGLTSWVLPSASQAVANGACLTGSGDIAQTPIPGCPAAGSLGGAGVQPGLQLTGLRTNSEGGVAYSSSVPSSLGLDVRFNSFQYGGSGADGISFFLAASDPTNASASPVTLGYTGGSLGYSPYVPGGSAGLSRAYLGIGLDVFGNFTNYNGTGCGATEAFAPQSVTVRGPGNVLAGYCQLATAHLASGTLGSAAPSAVPVEVAVNPTGSTQTAAGGFPVPANSFVVHVQPAGGGPPVELLGALPSASAFVPDSSWVDLAGVPQQLTFGWSASTGAVTDFHTISDVVVQTLNGTPPTLGVTLSSNGGGTAISGQTVVYTATPSIGGASETRPITLTDTFPAGLTPQPAGLGGTGWTCPAPSGQTVTCTHAGAGVGTLPPVSMPVVVNVASNSPPLLLSDTVTVGSPDAVQSSATTSDTYSPAPSATRLVFSGQPVNAKVNTAMPTSVTVAALTAGGQVDTAYSGTVSLTFANNPGAAQFVVAGPPPTTSILTANAASGVATFTPVVNAVGFGYTLGASAPGLSAATSAAFDVNAESTTCVQACTVTTTSTTGITAQVLAQAGSTVTATFGGNVVPITPCTGSTQGILTFSGTGLKLITMTFPVTRAKPVPVLFVCYGQPTPFLDILLRPTTYRNPLNGNEYEGVLPVCFPRLTGPCVKSVSFTRTSESIVIQSATGDPRVMG
jgi:hypothetical protein